MTSIAASLHRIRDRIATACAAAGRKAEEVTLVAVSKTHPAESVAEALAAGQAVFGENRVQEAAAKFPPLRESHPAMRLHLIGALQTNKARDAVRLADTIESLDRPKLAAALAEAMVREGRRPGLLIQVNIGREPQKAGIDPDAVEDFLALCRDSHGLDVTGLMCIPPAEEDPIPHFRRMAALRARLGLPILSMGMSGDFESAIAEGATHIRVGSAIFGQRPYPAG
ncbi:YggS family pyridoxal phosphate-dependent enzyme [Roseomonas marmotae]|uniref:Pyridoxal phosphate homeostasis protein n=1 Tax=Roseomonas marmotae TaxID=2768161 RepID=A0ABS3KGT3_9PROT|nr:YggS family pyridoxal phosphate-dependent enzyme [Roseomonas marmotae]MBO1076688.1 YggS family pyridoxal phosphate-dependent enzyme [Roseomonas marmotae]QTI79850.1 YggS family pyridoxal phosphate-dependent enzyme [Roseomonas marmotae]